MGPSPVNVAVTARSRILKNLEQMIQRVEGVFIERLEEVCHQSSSLFARCAGDTSNHVLARF